MAANDQRWISTDGNLTATSSWLPAETPTAGDSLYWDGTSQVGVNTNLAGLTGIDFTRIYFDPKYGGSIGASGNGLALGATQITFYGYGSFYHVFEPVASGNSYVVIDSPNQQDAYTLLSGATANMQLQITNGGATIANNAGTIQDMSVGSRSSLALPNVTIGSSVVIGQTYRQFSGNVITRSSLSPAGGTTAEVYRGALTVDASVTADWTLLVVSGGYVRYDGTGTLYECWVGPGATLDASRDLRAKTIGALILMPGSTFLTNPNVTVTKKRDFRTIPATLPSS